MYKYICIYIISTAIILVCFRKYKELQNNILRVSVSAISRVTCHVSQLWLYAHTVNFYLHIKTIDCNGEREILYNGGIIQLIISCTVLLLLYPSKARFGYFLTTVGFRDKCLFTRDVIDNSRGRRACGGSGGERRVAVVVVDDRGE